MQTFAHLNSEEAATTMRQLRDEYSGYCEKGLKLNMARGKPSSEQLDLSLPMLDVLSSSSDLYAQDGTDCRNYGVQTGLPEARSLMSAFLDDEPDNVIVFGNSSLNIMYDTIARCWMHGTLGARAWGSLPCVKWLCPIPGYDRHFAITESFGIEMINVAMNDAGPDMDVVEALVDADDSIKGIWCVPKYSNPTGATYSDETVRRLASMHCAADDFRIFWDNAYSVHHLYNDASKQDQLLDIAGACKEAGNPNRYYKFASTSKVTFPGAGISAMAASPENIAETKKRMNAQTIGYDKLNQLRHARYLKDAEGLARHMAAHAEIIRPKFELVERMLNDSMQGTGCTWTNPHGGYFMCFQGPAGTAQRIVSLAAGAGVVLTAAGAPFPYGKDPNDAVIRIAPTLPPLEELRQAIDVFICCAKLACLEVASQ